jgi:GDPmannose 4,6-dehydratase
LAAQSNVIKSCDKPQETIECNVLGVINLCEAISSCCPTCRMYQAGSSEMFGDSFDADGFQRETTAMNPITPYGISKYSAYKICQFYRQKHNMFIANGILFNHDSPRRSKGFLTRKVIEGVLDIKYNKQNSLYLGNFDVARDWGHSKDYVKSMLLMLEHEVPDDFVISMMTTHTVEYLVKFVCHKLNVPFSKIKQDETLKRKIDQKIVKGDSSKARRVLRWSPTYTFETLLEEMIAVFEQKYL